MSIGEISGIEPGRIFPSRQALYEQGVHRALEKGIVGAQKQGAESIVLSGGYIDDVDHGSVIVYTGDGGQDRGSKRHVKDQEFVRGNQALVTSCNLGLPVRVIRGSRHKSRFSPAEGYRYDGLYRVEDYWTEAGKYGFRICRFRLVSEERIFGHALTQEVSMASLGVPVKRSESIVQRIVRDSSLGRRVKELHKYSCQICGIRLDCVGGPYAEAAHVRPLGEPHNGPDELSNLLCLCPNHHVLLDRGAVTIDDDLVAQPLGLPLRQHRNHHISMDHIRYQRSIWPT